MITSQPADWLNLDDLKATLNKAGTSDDDELTRVMRAAQAAIVDRVGQMSPVDAVDIVQPRGLAACLPRGVIVLDHRPVISVTAVEELPGGAAVPPADFDAGTDGWWLDGSEGVLRHTTAFPPAVRVTYTAGRDPIPANYLQAGYELAAHLWRGSQLNAGGGRPPVGDTDEVVIPGIAYALPFRVRELLGLDSRPTDTVLIG